MAQDSEKQLDKIRTLFNKKQNPKALAELAKWLKKNPAHDDFALACLLCLEFQQFNFVIFSLKSRLKRKSDVLADLGLFADTAKQMLEIETADTIEHLVWLTSYINSIIPQVNNIAGLIYSLSLKLGYAVTSKRSTVVSVLNNFLAPLISKLLQADRYSDALNLESFAYDIYVKQAESEKSFSEFMTLVAQDMQAAGTRLRQRLPAPARASIHSDNTETTPVAFIIHNTSTLAHINAMLGFFEGLSELDECHIQPIVFSFAGKDPDMLERCAQLNVKVVALDENEADVCNKIVLLQQSIAAENCQTAVWLCLSNWMCFSFAYRLAPVQIWWSMKYHDFSSPDIDGYMCRFFVDDDFYNGQWRGGYLAVRSMFDTTKTPAAAELKASYGDKLVLGTLGRAELLNDPAFLTAVAGILQTNPNTVYLWTGREENQDIVRAFSNAKVLEQTQFIGWIDTQLYAQVFDVYLDVFGFGTGFTLVEAMAAGKPVVFLDVKRDFSILNVLRGIISNDLITLSADDQALLDQLSAATPEQYIAIANTLIASADLRAASGKVLARLSAIFENKALSAKIYQQHLDAIITTTLPKQQEASHL